MGNKSSLMLQDEEIKQISQETGFSATQIEKLYTRFAHLDRANCGALSKSDFMSIPELAINPLCDRLIQIFFSDCDEGDERINFRQFMRVLSTFRPTCNNSNENPTINNSTITNSKQPIKSLSTTSQSKNLAPVSHNISESRPKSIGESGDSARGNALQEDPVGKLNDSLRRKLSFVFKVYDADNDGRISFSDLKNILRMMVGNYIEDVQLDKIATRAFVEVDEDSRGFIEFTEFCKVFSGKDLDDKLRVKFFS